MNFDESSLAISGTKSRSESSKDSDMSRSLFVDVIYIVSDIDEVL